MSVDVSLEGIEVEHRKGKGQKKVILDGLDLVAQAGEVTVVMGDSGSGKTTLLRVVAGLQAPQKGQVHFGTEVVTRLPPWRRNVAMAFQSYALYPGQSVARNLELPLEAIARTNGGTNAERATRVERMLRSLGIWEIHNRDVRKISGGEQQRVALGRALIRRPRVLLLDEPLSNVDPSRRQEIIKLLRRLFVEHQVTTLLVTHDWEEAALLGERVAVLHYGTVVQQGTPEELYCRPENLKVLSFSQQGLLNCIEGLHRGEETRRLEHQAGRLRVLASDPLPEGIYSAVFRADHLQQGIGGFEASVKAVRPTGGVFHLELEAAGLRLFGSAPMSATPTPNTTLEVVVEPGTGWIADREGKFLPSRIERLEVQP